MTKSSREHLLRMYAALPEAYQPAWGFEDTCAHASRASHDRLDVLSPTIAVFPGDATLRILDIGCAQGYFSLALVHELRQLGRDVQMVGVDYLEDNVRFCTQLAEHHGLDARFIHDRFDAGFFDRHELEDFDVVLALNVLHHLRQKEGRQAVTAALAAIREHSRSMLCEIAQPQEALDWVDDWQGSDDVMLENFAFHRRLARFATHLTDVERPLYVCSESLAFVGGRWFGFERMALRSHSGVPEAFAGQRRFFFGKDVVIKGYRGDGSHGSFNRSELQAEAATLDTLKDEPDRYPRILAQADDGDMAWLVRELLPGRLLSDAIDKAEPVDRDAVASGLLEELAHLESRGFRHDDLRCWNVLLHEHGVRLIDFGTMVRTESPLQRVVLAAVLLEIARGQLSHEQPFYTALHPATAYPEEWRTLIRYLLEVSDEEFRYASALAVYRNGLHRDDQAGITPSADVLVAVAREQCDGFRRLLDHTHASEDALEESRRYVDGLRMEIERVNAHDLQLERALADTARNGEELREQIAREANNASVEREAFEAARRGADSYAESLEQALSESQRYASSLEAATKQALEESQIYTSSLKVALGESQRYASSLEVATKQTLEESQTYTSSLQKALEESQAYASSLQQALEESQTTLTGMQRRFRWLKPLWPRTDDKHKEDE